MVALMILLAVVTALAAVLAIVIHQIAEANRHRYFEEVTLSGLALGMQEVGRSHVPTAAVAHMRKAATPRRRIVRVSLGAGHSIPFPR